MREVKFRVWDGNKMYYDIPKINFATNSAYYIDCVRDYREVDIVALTQYTGLKDKDGVEIYEKDLVKVRGNTIYSVEYIDYGFFLVGLGRVKSHIINMLPTERYEVIGNFYENQELFN